VLAERHFTRHQHFQILSLHSPDYAFFRVGQRRVITNEARVDVGSFVP
jgi:hypothetical protein